MIPPPPSIVVAIVVAFVVAFVVAVVIALPLLSPEELQPGLNRWRARR